MRTISRDIEEMKLFYNAPITFDRAKNGYYYTEDSFYIKDISLSEGELFSVALFERLLSGYRNTPLEKHLRSVFRKIAESLGERATIDTMYLDDSVTYISEPLAQIDAEVFNAVFSAVRQSKEIRFDYRPLQKQTYMSRTVRPYHIVCQKGSWYVLGYSHHAEAIRLYAMPRIRNCKITKEKFKIPKDFKLSDHIDVQMGAWGNSGEKFKVEIEFVKGLKTFVMERTWHKGQTLRENKDGSVYLSFETNQLSQTASWVMSFTGGAKVLNPPELKDEVRAAAQRILANG